MFTIPFMARRTRLVILRLNIPCRQRQIVYILSEVHISIIIQVNQDISNIETIVQSFPSFFSIHKGYFSIILSAIHHESFRLTKMHKLSRKDANLHVL